ncbi:CocE/NonD family hydrolase [Phytohabitans kaempferiae]|uniref:CocE/NonD family hydrolase n=1 Tax=Phytohabitans kaempferiae TaxID=1620943 RepID=A0ABV6MHJ5_9ACTN
MPTAEPTVEIQIVRDARVPGPYPGYTLSADLFLPAGGTPVPALVTVLPYRTDLGGAHDASYRWLARHGYACVLVNQAGVGSSDGLPHQPWGPGETDDAVAAIRWAAAQPWCTGDVGMWGTSHGGFTSMAAAGRGLPALKAIIAMENALDVEHDIMHPAGERGDFLRLASWGGRMLLQQILPPLRNHTSLAEQRRWRRRLHEVEPYLVELASMGPGDPRWRERAVDPTAVTVPTMCVGGWYDPYADAVPRAYEQLTVPKKLIMGPWGHVLPHESPSDPIDFLAIALRWWNRWLRGIDDGFMDEPEVVLHVRGHNAGWRAFEAWPPGKDQLVLGTGASTVLCTTPRAETAPAPIAAYDPDPTAGALSGLRGVAAPARPLDQHTDDMRALHFTSEPLPADVLLCGRPEVSVRVAGTGALPQRLVVRLTDVDPDGRSTFVTDGIHRPGAPAAEHRVTLGAAAYRLRAGHRLRLVVGDADFPRLTPLPEPAAFQVTAVAVVLATVADDAGSPVDVPPLGTAPTDRRDRQAGWALTRAPVADSVEISVGSETGPVLTPDGHRLTTNSDVRARVRRDHPEESVVTAMHTGTVRTDAGETIAGHVTLRCTQTALHARATLTIDGLTTYEKAWDVPLVPLS